MRTLKTMLAVGVLLGATQMAQGALEPANKAKDADFTFTVQDLTTLNCVTTAGTVKDDDKMLLAPAATDSKLATAEIVCTIVTNKPAWNLTIKGKNSGKLMNDVTPFKTSTVTDGTLGNSGTVYVYLKSVSPATAGITVGGDPVTANASSATATGAEVNISAGTAASVAAAFKIGATGFQSIGTVTAGFGIKAGVKGIAVTAGTGTYKETITVDVEVGFI